jgi:hypothetical protein
MMGMMKVKREVGRQQMRWIEEVELSSTHMILVKLGQATRI